MTTPSTSNKEYLALVVVRARVATFFLLAHISLLGAHGFPEPVDTLTLPHGEVFGTPLKLVPDAHAVDANWPPVGLLRLSVVAGGAVGLRRIPQQCQVRGLRIFDASPH